MKKGTLVLVFSAVAALQVNAQFSPASLVTAADKAPYVYITGVDAKSISFQVDRRRKDVKKVDRNRVKSIFFSEPRSFSQAMESYRAGDFETALTGFESVSKSQEAVKSLPGNYGSLADLYVAECHRQTGDFAKLKASTVSLKESLFLNSYDKEQVKLYNVWEAAAAKAWGRILTVAGDYDAAKLNSEQMAQLAYLSGLALENQKKPKEAIDSYNKVLVVDMLSNQALAQQSILRALGLLAQDEQVKAAKKAIDAKQEASGLALQSLYQAAALSAVYQTVLKDAPVLPADLAVFSKYTYKVGGE